MLRAPIKWRLSCVNSPVVPSTCLTLDLIPTATRHPSPMWMRAKVAEMGSDGSSARPAGTESGRGLPQSTTLRDSRERSAGTESLSQEFRSCALCDPCVPCGSFPSVSFYSEAPDLIRDGDTPSLPNGVAVVRSRSQAFDAC